VCRAVTREPAQQCPGILVAQCLDEFTPARCQRVFVGTTGPDAAQIEEAADAPLHVCVPLLGDSDRAGRNLSEKQPERGWVRGNVLWRLLKPLTGYLDS
jgi:hypothetical protein